MTTAAVKSLVDEQLDAISADVVRLVARGVRIEAFLGRGYTDKVADLPERIGVTQRRGRQYVTART